MSGGGNLVQRVDDIGVGRVIFGALLVMLVEAGALEGRLRRGQPLGMQRQHLLTEVGEGRATDRRWRSGEAEVDHAGIEPEDFENLRPLVAVERRDAHLGEHLEGAVFECRDVVLLRTAPVGRPAFEMARRSQRLDRCQAEPGTDGLRPIAEQADDVVHLAGFVRLDHQAGQPTQALAHEVVVHRSDGKQRRDWRALRAGLAI